MSELTDPQLRALIERETFILGYMTALADIERTGLQPMTPHTRRESAVRAWRTENHDRGREVLADA